MSLKNYSFILINKKVFKLCSTSHHLKLDMTFFHAERTKASLLIQEDFL